MANINGWGRSTWGSSTWGEPISVDLTGLAGTGAVGTVLAAGYAIAGVSGTGSTISQGDETVTCDANIYPTGVAGTSALGSL